MGYDYSRCMFQWLSGRGFSEKGDLVYGVLYQFGIRFYFLNTNDCCFARLFTAYICCAFVQVEGDRGGKIISIQKPSTARMNR